MIPLPFSTQSYQNRSLPASSQRCYNLYPESVTDGKSPVVLHGTPGLKAFSSGAIGAVRGAHVMNEVLYAVIGTYLYKIKSDGSQTQIGVILGNEHVSIADNGTELAIVTGVNGYVYNGVLTTITDGDFPKSSIVAFINQRMLYNSTFGFTYSDLDSSGVMAGSVNGTGLPDKAKSILTDHLEVWLFSDNSIEVWYDSGDLVDVFQRSSGAFIERGCAAKFTPAKMDNSVYWLGDDFAVYVANQYTPQRVSTPTIEREFQSYTVEDAFAFTYTEESHTFYQITFPTDNKTWVYDVATQRWHERGNFTAGRHRANCYAYAYGKHLVGDFINGKIYELDLDTYTDDGDLIQRTAITPPLHQAGEDLFMSKLWVDFEPGTGLTTGQGSDPQAMIQGSIDGGKTWTNERWTTIGKIGKYRNKAIWRRLGTFTQRIFRLVISDPIKVVIIGAYGEF